MVDVLGLVLPCCVRAGVHAAFWIAGVVSLGAFLRRLGCCVYCRGADVRLLVCEEVRGERSGLGGK